MLGILKKTGKPLIPPRVLKDVHIYKVLLLLKLIHRTYMLKKAGKFKYVSGNEITFRNNDYLKLVTDEGKLFKSFNNIQYTENEDDTKQVIYNLFKDENVVKNVIKEIEDTITKNKKSSSILTETAKMDYVEKMVIYGILIAYECLVDKEIKSINDLIFEDLNSAVKTLNNNLDNNSINHNAKIYFDAGIKQLEGLQADVDLKHSKKYVKDIVNEFSTKSSAPTSASTSSSTNAPISSSTSSSTSASTSSSTPTSSSATCTYNFSDLENIKKSIEEIGGKSEQVMKLKQLYQANDDLLRLNDPKLAIILNKDVNENDFNISLNAIMSMIHTLNMKLKHYHITSKQRILTQDEELDIEKYKDILLTLQKNIVYVLRYLNKINKGHKVMGVSGSYPVYLFGSKKSKKLNNKKLNNKKSKKLNNKRRSNKKT